MISVIIPIYNVEEYLRECVDSVINQTFKDIEIILVDDGSPDNCPQICEEYAKKDNRVKVIHKKNGGLSDARNEGLKIATGDYVIFLDSDDYWQDDDFLQSMFETLVKNDFDVVMCNFAKKNNIITYQKDFDLSYNNKNLLEIISYLVDNDLYSPSAWSKLFKKSILIDNKLFFLKGIIHEDILWNIQLLLSIKSFGICNSKYIYRWRNNSLSKKIKEKNIIDFLYVFEKSIQYNNESNSELKDKNLSFLCYVYLTFLGHIWSLPKKKLYYLIKARKFKFLINYNSIKKTNKIVKLIKIFDIYIASFLLHLYIKYR